MSQAERLSKMHFLLESGGKVTVAKFMETLEVSRATIMRDIQLMRDRLGSPIAYDKKKKSYSYSSDSEYSFHDRKFELPGIWINEREGYALLTLLNVTSQIDPGLLMPYTGKLRGTLKRLLCERHFQMKGFHKKVSVQIPNLSSGNPDVMKKISEALVDERQANVTWLGENDIPIKATASFQRYVLKKDGWSAEFVNKDNQSVLNIPLCKFIDCSIKEEAANILPMFKSDSQSDIDALYDLYRLER